MIDYTALFVMLAVIFMYFLPTVVAGNQRRRNRFAIFLLNFFAGWTVVGWVVAMVWAVHKEKRAHAEI